MWLRRYRRVRLWCASGRIWLREAAAVIHATVSRPINDAEISQRARVPAAGLAASDAVGSYSRASLPPAKKIN